MVGGDKLPAMEQALPSERLLRGGISSTLDYAVYAGILVLGFVLYWLVANRPAMLPDWMPWEFSPPEYLATALTLFWAGRGLMLTPAAERPSLWRGLAFLAGLALIYAVLQTRFEYWSQHMFFLNRIQHVVMHHIGPFLMALAGFGAVLRRGLPDWLRQFIEGPKVAALMRVLQQPVVAALLFVGLFALWLIPPQHFRAMLDGRLYALMNWSMVLDGLLFWSLVLDRRPKPPARIGYGARAVLSIVVMFPQIVLGAIISFSTHDLYPYYTLCGRIIPSVGAINDQHIGGIIIWIPPAMMSILGMLMVLNALRKHEEARLETDPQAARLAALASRWTGR
jgi:putative membrane protein